LQRQVAIQRPRRTRRHAQRGRIEPRESRPRRIGGVEETRLAAGDGHVGLHVDLDVVAWSHGDGAVHVRFACAGDGAPRSGRSW
jgi:hypothetical protein